MTNNFVEKINEIIKKFAENQLLVLIGFEFEFYITKSDSNGEISYSAFENKEIKDKFSKKANEILAKNQFNGILVYETDDSQFEIISSPSLDPCYDFLKIKKSLEEIDNFIKSFNQNYKICTLAKPFLDKPGNGLHFHISLHKIPSLENIFETNDDFHPFLRNKFMAMIVGVLMHDLKKNIKKFLTNENIIKRISNPDRNTPTNFSWGKNNRTTALRIPERPPKSRTIEFRVPSSENDFYESLYLFLESCFKAIFKFDEFLNENSLNEKNFLQGPTFGLAFDEQYNLEKFIDFI